MAFNDIAKKIKYPDHTSVRFKRLDAYDRLRQSTFYDHIKTSFDTEDDGSGGYIRLKDRRPSIIWNGAKMLVDQLSGLLWGDEQMPIIRTYEGEEPDEGDQEAEQGIQHISETLSLDAVMDGITDIASSGSAAVVLRNTDDKQLWIEVIPGKEVTPKFDPRNPMKLTSIEQLYPTNGQALFDMGYHIKEEDLGTDYWFRLTIDGIEEVRYLPMKAEDYEMLGQIGLNGKKIQWERDEDNTWSHGWGVIPVLWAKAPCPNANKTDGDCLYGSIVDILVSIDYNLSQVQRGYRYTADPMVAIKRGELNAGSRPAGYDIEGTGSNADASGNIVKSPAKIVDVEPGGDAKILEISAQGLAAFGEMIKMLREYGLEIAGGMKSDAEHAKGPESGRALEMLFQSLILVVKRWRTALGNNCYLPLMRLILLALEKSLITIEGLEKQVPTNTTMRLVWPSWMTPTGSDLLATANAYQSLAGGSAQAPVPVLPRSIVTRIAAMNLGMNDVTAIIEELEAQVQEDEQKAQDQADMDAKRTTDQAVAVAKAKPTNGVPVNK